MSHGIIYKEIQQALWQYFICRRKHKISSRHWKESLLKGNM